MHCCGLRSIERLHDRFEDREALGHRTGEPRRTSEPLVCGHPPLGFAVAIDPLDGGLGEVDCTIGLAADHPGERGLEVEAGRVDIRGSIVRTHSVPQLDRVLEGARCLAEGMRLGSRARRSHP